MNNSNWIKYYEEKKGLSLIYPEAFLIGLLLAKGRVDMVKSLSRSSSTVLDLSCGYGRNLGLLTSIYGDVYATEVDEAIVEAAKTNFPFVKYRVGKANSLPFDSCTFDSVFACNSLYYLEERSSIDANLAEISRVLKDDGQLIGYVPRSDSTVIKEQNGSHGAVNVKSGSRPEMQGSRIFVFSSDDQLREKLSSYFKHVELGLSVDEFKAVRRELSYFVCSK
jgi:SAM-dependent methyltransferase